MSKKISVYLPDKVAQWLEDWANDEGRTMSSLAAFLIEQSVRAEQQAKAKQLQVFEQEKQN